MAEIVKTQLHPDGDKDTVLHPETSVEQIVDFESNKYLNPTYYNHSIVLTTPGSYINIRIITKNTDIFTYSKLIEFLKDNFNDVNKNTYECTGFSTINNTVITGIRVNSTFTSLIYHYGYDGIGGINDFDTKITDTVMSI